MTTTAAMTATAAMTDNALEIDTKTATAAMTAAALEIDATQLSDYLLLGSPVVRESWDDWSFPIPSPLPMMLLNFFQNSLFRPDSS